MSSGCKRSLNGGRCTHGPKGQTLKLWNPWHFLGKAPHSSLFYRHVVTTPSRRGGRNAGRTFESIDSFTRLPKGVRWSPLSL